MSSSTCHGTSVPDGGHTPSPNRHKRGVSFKEAESAFADELGRLMADPDHSDQRDRFILMGASHRLRLLDVCHCSRYDDTIRIISARKANRLERTDYERYKNA